MANAKTVPTISPRHYASTCSEI